KAVEALIGALSAKNISVRHAATHALGQIGPEAKAAVPALTKLLSEKDSGVRQAAVRALGQIGPEAKPAVPALIKLLPEENPYWVLDVAEALLILDPSTAKTVIPVLVRVLGPP